MEIYIFDCNDETEKECFEKHLFGGKSIQYTVRPGDLCLLFNYSQGWIYGVFKATSGSANIDPGAWKDAVGRPFPEQVRVELDTNEKIKIPRSKVGHLVNDPITGKVSHRVYGPEAEELLEEFASGYSYLISS